MFTKYLTAILIILLVIVQSTTVFAQTKTAQEIENQAVNETDLSIIRACFDSIEDGDV